MNWSWRNILIGAIAVAGIGGSFSGGRALRQAMISAQNLYRIDTIGSQIESAIEFQTQESRRAFLYALAIGDRNEQLRFIDESKVAGRVEDAVDRLRQLGMPDLAKPIDTFETSWQRYALVRDEIVAKILGHQAAAALETEQTTGRPRFAEALQRLHQLKAVIDAQASRDSADVGNTLARSLEGLVGFTVCALIIVIWLSKINRDRHAALESLKASSQALAEAREMERHRASVLELVSRHVPLSQALGRIAELAPHCSAPAGAAMWAAAGMQLHFQVSANLPDEMAEEMARLSLPRSDETSEDWANKERQRLAIAAKFGFAKTQSRTLHDAGGHTIGLLQVSAPDLCGGPREAVVEQMANLASVAIDNTLMHERLAFQAQHDTLTELPNRLLFQDRVQQALQLARRHRRRTALLWIDLDRYKQVNDSLGHRVGDEVLCEVARRIKGALRESDTVARVGGDEFTVLANDIRSGSDAELVCRKILAEIARSIPAGDHQVTLTGSAGISIFPDHGEDPVVLMRHADLAMYSAKREGGGVFRLFRPALGESMLRRMELERELSAALERGEFSLDYQPLMDTRGRLDCLEALLRWNNKSLGRVSPADFIPVAEEMGLISAIGEWVTRTACATGTRWLSAGYDVPRIAVNVSGFQFAGQTLAPLVMRTLQETAFPANKLVLEITETTLMNSLDQALRQIGELRSLGVRFAIDDFGTGYSSLSQLRSLPVDSVKIDRSFVKDLDLDGAGSSTLVRGIIALAHSLALEVVAEGVETEQQLNLLRSMGCDVNQGFYLHRPMPAQRVEELLQPDRASQPQPATAELAALQPMEV